jgi:drug/metabolite transporter (DMT)-like permease
LNPAHTRSVLYLVAAALCWSLAGLLIKHVATTWPALAIAGMRGLIAAVFLLLTERGLSFRFSRLQIIAACVYAMCTVTFCAATAMTTAANAILLQYTAPVWVALGGAWLLGERTTKADWITIVAALGGMTLFFADGLESGHLAGDALAVFSGVCFAAMTITMRKQKDGSPVESIILGNLIAFVVGLPWIIGAPTLAPIGWGSLLILGIVQLGISYWLYVRAIKHVSALEAVLIPVIEPILNPIWVLLALHEKPTPYAMAGGAIVLTAVTLRAVASVRARRTAPAPAVH